MSRFTRFIDHTLPRIGHFCLFLIALHFLCTSALSQSASGSPLAPTIHYTLSVQPPEANIQTAAATQFHIAITTQRSNRAFQDFAIPAWTPGYYQIVHYEAGIHNAKAQDSEGHALPVVHNSGRVWRIDTTSLTASPAGSITISYDVDAKEEGLGFFGSSLDTRNQRGYINCASALMFPVGQTQTSCTLSLEIPTGWQVATPMEPASASNQKLDDAQQPASFQARTYDELIDCPIQMGKFDTIDFQDSGVQYQCILVGRQTGSTEGIRASLQRITHAAIAVFGTAPFKRYQFIYHLGGSGFYGGLEHHNSTVIHLATGLGSGANEDFLSTSAHEFFHAWNVKRLRPEGLGPFDYTQEVHTSSLWFAEGVTDYYAQLLLVRSGLKTREWFWRDMLKRIQELDRTPSRVSVSLREASARAWEGGSEGYDGLSYYLKGSLVGLYFDLRLHALTHNHAGLDDVMRRLETLYGTHNQAYPENAILAAINAVAHQDLQSEYTRLVDSMDEIDWNTALQSAGLSLQRDTAPFLGLRLAEEQDSHQAGALIQSVEAGHAAARMGIHPGDRLLSVQGRNVTSANFLSIIHALTPHSAVTLEVQRGNEIISLNGTVGEIYDHHQLTTLPVGQLSPQDQQEARELLNKIFAPTLITIQTAQKQISESVAP